MSTAYHAHVYFSDDSLADAMRLRESAPLRFPMVRVGRVHEAAFAFHPQPMYQLAFDSIQAGPLLEWLALHRGGLSILVHPLGGGVVQEHIDDAIWFGTPLTLDRESLQRIADAPSAPEEAVKPDPAELTVLRIDASARLEGSVSRQLADELVETLTADRSAEVVRRDLSNGLPLLEPELVAVLRAPDLERTPAQEALMETAERLLAELEAADVLVLALPIYNFHVPAAFKAWIDLVARPRRTFRYTPKGPVGMLSDRPVYIVITSGGTRLHSPADFVTGWLRHMLGFLGLHDVHFIEADGLMMDADGAMARARAQISDLPATHATK